MKEEKKAVLLLIPDDISVEEELIKVAKCKSKFLG